MKRNLILGSAFAIAILLAATGVSRGQEAPSPPAAPLAPAMMPMPPEPPAPPAMAAPQGDEFFFGGSGAWLGVSLQDVTAEKARELKLPGEYGALITDVNENSPAAQAGLKKGDVILQFAGERVRSVAELRRLIRETPPSRTVAIQISRNGQLQTMNVKLKSRDHFSMQIPRIQIEPFRDRNFDYRFLLSPGPRLGISGEDLTPQLAKYFGVKEGEGVLVREVEPGSAAEKAGIKAGDVITHVGDTEVSSPDSLRRALPHDFEGKKTVSLTLVRDRHEQTVNVELEAPENMLRPLEKDITRAREHQLQQMSAEMAQRKFELQKALEQANRALTQERQQQLAQVSAEMAKHQAELKKALEQANRAWTLQRQRYLEETQKSLQLLQHELQKQKLQQIRIRQQHEEVI